MAPIYPVRGVDSLKYFDGQTFYNERLEEINNLTDIIVRRKLYDIYGDISSGIIFRSPTHTSLAVTTNAIDPTKIDINYGMAYTKEYERIYVPVDPATSKVFPEFDNYSGAKYSGITFARPARESLDRTTFGLLAWVVGETYYVWAGYKKEYYRDVSSETQGVDFKELEFDSYLFYISKKDTPELADYEATLTYEPHWVLLATIEVTAGPTLTIRPTVSDPEATYCAPYAYFNDFVDEENVRITPPYLVPQKIPLRALIDYNGDAPSTGSAYVKNPFLVAPWNMGMWRTAQLMNVYLKLDLATKTFSILGVNGTTGYIYSYENTIATLMSFTTPQSVTYVDADTNFYIWCNITNPAAITFGKTTLSCQNFYFSQNVIPLAFVQKLVGGVPSYSCVNGVLDAKTFAQMKVGVYTAISGNISDGASVVFSLPTTIDSPSNVVGVMVEWDTTLGLDIWSNGWCGHTAAPPDVLGLGYYYHLDLTASPITVEVFNELTATHRFRLTIVFRHLTANVFDFDSTLYI